MRDRGDSNVVEWLKSVDNANLVRIRLEAIQFFRVLYIIFPLNFVKIFDFQSEMLSRDLNVDGSNWPRWIRVCYFHLSGMYPSKSVCGDKSVYSIIYKYINFIVDNNFWHFKIFLIIILIIDTGSVKMIGIFSIF